MAADTNHDAQGRFRTGNTAGRKPKFRSAPDAAKGYRQALLRVVEPRDLMQVASALLVDAKQGDVMAAREIFDRLLGKGQDRPLQQLVLEHREYTLPPIESAQDLLVATKALAEAVAANKVDERRAAKLQSLLEQMRKTYETITLQDRLDALENLIRSRAMPTEGARLRMALSAQRGEEGADVVGDAPPGD